MSVASPTREEVFAILEAVRDPEVPVLSVVELGVVRDVALAPGETIVTITPTYSGCPALRVMEREVVEALARAGLPNPRVVVSYTPAWTTDWIGPDAREKLRAYGIAPPGPRRHDDAPDVLVQLLRAPDVVACPYCGSRDTELRSEFGPTACKSIRFCRGCSQPFEQFKAI
ncbi:MAG: 1,2-phenylacetyl-CoA epoxidase subunit PaaD [Gemmatimonadota bacterium]